jgi:hypothetical protein
MKTSHSNIGLISSKTLILHSIKLDDMEALQSFYALNQNSLNEEKIANHEYLYEAIFSNSIRVMWFFISIGTNLTFFHNKYKNPLHHAAQTCRLKICEILAAKLINNIFDISLLSSLDLLISSKKHKLTDPLRFLASCDVEPHYKYNGNQNFHKLNHDFTNRYGISPLALLKILHSLEQCRTVNRAEFDELFSGTIAVVESKVYKQNLISVPAILLLNSIEPKIFPTIAKLLKFDLTYDLADYFLFADLIHSNKPKPQVTGEINLKNARTEIEKL